MATWLGQSLRALGPGPIAAVGLGGCTNRGADLRGEVAREGATDGTVDGTAVLGEVGVMSSHGLDNGLGEVPLDGAAEGTADGAAVLGVSRPSRGFIGAARAQKGRGEPAAEGAEDWQDMSTSRRSGALSVRAGSETQLLLRPRPCEVRVRPSRLSLLAFLESITCLEGAAVGAIAGELWR